MVSKVIVSHLFHDFIAISRYCKSPTIWVSKFFSKVLAAHPGFGIQALWA